MSNADLLIAANTIWVVVAAVLVMFMQAGFAFLEAGLTRMKNAAHIAGKNVLIFGICSLVYWAVGFGIAFGDDDTPGVDVVADRVFHDANARRTLNAITHPLIGALTSRRAAERFGSCLSSNTRTARRLVVA